MFFTKNTIALSFLMICTLTFSQVAISNTQNQLPTPNQPQLVNEGANAPFLTPGNSVIIVGDNEKHNYVVDMDKFEKESIFRKYSIIFVGFFLIISILIFSFLYFYISRKHKLQDGIIKDEL